MRVCIIGPKKELWLDDLPEISTVEWAKILFCLDFCYAPNVVVLNVEGSEEKLPDARLLQNFSQPVFFSCAINDGVVDQDDTVVETLLLRILTIRNTFPAFVYHLTRRYAVIANKLDNTNEGICGNQYY